MTEKVRVLLVEDDPDDVVLVSATLRDDPSAAFTLTVAGDARLAAEHLRTADFDVALLDLSLPDAQGLESFSTVLAHADETPIIVLTGLDDEEVALQAVHRGAQDYLVKGRVNSDLLVRSIRYARERHRLLAERTRHLKRELEVAALVQRTFLPEIAPTLRHYEVGGYLHSSGQIGGDFYDFIDLGDGRLAVAVGDASGKGIPGAILMAKAQAVLRAEVARHVSPVELVRNLNRLLCDGQRLDRFVTLFYGVLTVDDGQFRYASAGHPRALQFYDVGRDVLTSTGPPLGLFADSPFEERTVTVGASDRLIVYSDGVSEAQSPDDRFFDEAGICDVAASYPQCAAADLARRICQAAERFEDGNPTPGDDKTVVVMQGLAQTG